MRQQMTDGDRHPKLPFEVDRRSAMSLIDQVVDGFRRAIVCGFYPNGATLPTFVDVASGLGVSMNVVRTAMGRLSDEGLVGARRGVGCIVNPSGTKLCLGRVVVVQMCGDEGYYFNVLGGVVREALSRAGYFVTGITVFRRARGAFDFSRLEMELREQTDLVVLISDNAPTIALLSRLGAPFIVVGRKRAKPAAQCCLGYVCEDFDAGMDAVAAECARIGIRRALVVRAWRRESSVFAALRSAGIKAEDWCIPMMRSRYGRIEGVQRAGMEAFAARLRSGRDWLPDLLLFPDDDVLASGCLTALACAGVRIPEDVRVVTLSNKGLGPVYPKSLARLEIDPASFGEAVARFARGLLSGDRTLAVPVLSSTYVPGESLQHSHVRK